jgi:hypothetical protein
MKRQPTDGRKYLEIIHLVRGKYPEYIKNFYKLDKNKHFDKNLYTFL